MLSREIRVLTPYRERKCSIFFFYVKRGSTWKLWLLPGKKAGRLHERVFELFQEVSQIILTSKGKGGRTFSETLTIM